MAVDIRKIDGKLYQLILLDEKNQIQYLNEEIKRLEDGVIALQKDIDERKDAKTKINTLKGE